MTFQAYIENIKAKTGKTPEDFRKLAEKKGLLEPGVKAMENVNWLKKDYGLGHGHGNGDLRCIERDEGMEVSGHSGPGRITRREDPENVFACGFRSPVFQWQIHGTILIPDISTP